ncbi:hypothetical protein BAZMOX_00686_1 [methanotrophic endosymbiont of Bathymodiolus azoricus (Menez Gwen)]|nr:hypothetical protein BAZMOX_00686_1 [methanotrophic endosymbiont of Bathymodiolus azoricus (Menez Gwen)]
MTTLKVFQLLEILMHFNLTQSEILIRYEPYMKLSTRKTQRL